MSEEQSKVRLEAVLFETKDPESLSEFYHQAFDLEPPRFYGPDHLGMNLVNTYLGFDRSSEASGEALPRIQMWFRVDNIEAAFQRLLNLGARAIYAPDSLSSPGEILALVSDPDGNRVGLICALARE